MKILFGVLIFSGIFSVQLAFGAPKDLFRLDLENPEYSTYFEEAKGTVDDTKNECAKFLNRIFSARFGVFLWGNAWDLPLREQNQRYIDLIWRVPEEDFQTDSLWVRDPMDRLYDFQELYSVVDEQEYPIGVLGFLYRYSGVKDLLREAKALPQSHVSFLAGKKSFKIANASNTQKTVRDLLEDQYGIIHPFEESFVNERLLSDQYFVGKRVSLDTVLKSQEFFWIHDYLIEEQFRFSRTDSLLGLFLRKHRNNKKEALLRPVSFARLSDSFLSTLIHEKTSPKNPRKK